MKATLAVAIAALSVSSIAEAKNCTSCNLNKLKQELLYEIDQVDREDMRVKSGVVQGDTLTLRVEDEKKSRGRNFIYGKDVDIDVGSLEESAEIIQGDKATLFDANQYSDHGDAATLESANAYTDEAIANIQHPDWQPQITAAETRANEYTDFEVAAAKAYADDGDAATLSAAMQHAEASDAQTLEYAKVWSAQADDDVLEQAKQHSTDLAEALAAADRVIRTDMNLLTESHTQLQESVYSLSGEVYNLSAGVQQNTYAIDQLTVGVQQNADSINSLDRRLDTVESVLDAQRRDIREGVAAVTAMSMVQQDPSANGLQLSVGGGWFQGQTGGAVVMGTRVADRVYVNAGASFGGVTTYGASATVRLGGNLFVVKRRD